LTDKAKTGGNIEFFIKGSFPANYRKVSGFYSLPETFDLECFVLHCYGLKSGKEC
jgi:hypothetical protein